MTFPALKRRDDWGDQFDAPPEPEVLRPESAEPGQGVDRALVAFGRLAARVAVPRPYRRRFRDAWTEETADDSDLAVFLEALGIDAMVGDGLAGVGSFLGGLHPALRALIAAGAMGGVAFVVRQDLRERIIQESRGAGGAHAESDSGPGPSDGSGDEEAPDGV